MGILSKILFFMLIFPVNLYAQEKIADFVVSDDLSLEKKVIEDTLKIPNFRAEMRDIVTAISDYAKERNKNFFVLTRQGGNLLNIGEWEENLEEVKIAASRGVFGEDEVFMEKLFNPSEMQKREIGFPVVSYSSRIDGIIEDRFECNDEVLNEFALKEIENRGIRRISIRYCPDKKSFFDEIAKDRGLNHVNFDKNGDFSEVPKGNPIFLNSENVSELKKAKNMLMVTNYKNYDTKDALLDDLQDTNHDLIIINPFFNKNNPLKPSDVNSLKYKKLGAKRLVFAKLDVSRLGPGDFYFKQGFKQGEPKWLKFMDTKHPEKFVTEYYNPEFKEILGRYIKGIVDLGFDGVLLDGVDAHLLFEKNTGID